MKKRYKKNLFSYCRKSATEKFLNKIFLFNDYFTKRKATDTPPVPTASLPSSTATGDMRSEVLEVNPELVEMAFQNLQTASKQKFYKALQAAVPKNTAKANQPKWAEYKNWCTKHIVHEFDKDPVAMNGPEKRAQTNRERCKVTKHNAFMFIITEVCISNDFGFMMSI